MNLHELFRLDFTAPSRLVYEFSLYNGAALYGIVLILFVLWRFQGVLTSKKWLPLSTTVLGYALFFAPFFYTWIVASIGGASWQTDLPYQATHIVSFIFGLSLLKGYRIPLRRLYLLAASTFLFNLAFPMTAEFTTSPLLFIMYYIQLLLIIVALVFVIRAKLVTVDWHLYASSIQWTSFVLIFFFAANLIMESNYFYINAAPDTVWTPMIWFGDSPFWYLVSSLAANLLFHSLLFVSIAFPLVKSTIKELVKYND